MTGRSPCLMRRTGSSIWRLSKPRASSMRRRYYKAIVYCLSVMTMKINLQEVKKLSTIISDKLVEEIQNGQLKPGTRLIQTDLAEQFGVSRVAIRDALMELRNRGLSINVPMKGDIVRPVSLKTIQELFDIRGLLEAHAVKTAVERIDAQGIQLIQEKARAQEEAVAAGDIQQIIETDWNFHSSIYRYCDNESLIEMIEAIWMRIRQARSIARSDSDWGSRWGRASVKRHRLLMRAIRSGDGEKAASITVENIGKAGRELIEELKAQGWDTGS